MKETIREEDYELVAVAWIWASLSFIILAQ